MKTQLDQLLEKEGIKADQLSSDGQKALKLYNRSLELYMRRKDNKEMTAQAEKMGHLALDQIEEDIKRIRAKKKEEEHTQEHQEKKKAGSKKVLEESEKVLDDLTQCRERLKEDRKNKIESGEIKPPKKQTLTSRLRNELLRIPAMIPKKLKENPKVISRTQTAVLKFLSELKKIWELNKVKGIQQEIKDKFRKLEELAGKE